MIALLFPKIVEGDGLPRSLYVLVSITEERDIRVHERKEGES